MKIGMLTSGGDCPGLNAVMRAFAKYVCSHIEDVKIFGFLNGYTGLIENEYEILAEKDFEPLLLAGGTVLGSKRQPFKQMTVSDGNNRSKLDKMKETYETLAERGRTRRPRCSPPRGAGSSVCPRRSTTTSGARTSPSGFLRQWRSPRNVSTACTARRPATAAPCWWRSWATRWAG